MEGLGLGSVNPFVSIPQEPIPHVQQALTKAAGWKIFVDLDMTNSFHQIPIDDESSNLLSVSIRVISTKTTSCPEYEMLSMRILCCS